MVSPQLGQFQPEKDHNIRALLGNDDGAVQISPEETEEPDDRVNARSLFSSTPINAKPYQDLSNLLS